MNRITQFAIPIFFNKRKGSTTEDPRGEAGRVELHAGCQKGRCDSVKGE